MILTGKGSSNCGLHGYCSFLLLFFGQVNPIVVGLYPPATELKEGDGFTRVCLLAGLLRKLWMDLDETYVCDSRVTSNS